MKARVVPDGTILHAIRVPLGHWEAKDTDDDLDEEIEKKRRKAAIRPTTSSSRTAAPPCSGRTGARSGAAA